MKVFFLLHDFIFEALIGLSEIEAYTLDFNTHVKLPSKKNFQLINENDRTVIAHQP